MRLLFVLIALLCVACNRPNNHTAKPKYDVDFEATHIVGAYYGSEASQAYNYYILLSDVSAESGEVVPNATYYYFDIYSDIFSQGGLYVDFPTYDGTTTQYKYDPLNKQYSGTFSAEYSYAITTDETGAMSYLYYLEGWVNISRNSIEAELIMEDGQRHRVRYSGTPAFRNLNTEPLTTLNKDIELNLTNMTMYAELHTEYQSYIDYSYVMLSEDSEFRDGVTLIFELLTPSSNPSIYGSYEALDSYDISYRYFPGTIEQELLRGVWYTVLENGSVSSQMAPIVNGTITINEGESGEMLFTLNCKDDGGNNITGTVSTLAPSNDEPAPTTLIAEPRKRVKTAILGR